MGWLGDIAVLGVVVVGGWWFFNNYKNLGIGGGGSTAGGEVSPLEGGEAAPATDNIGRPNTVSKTCADGTTYMSPDYGDDAAKAAARKDITQKGGITCGKCSNSPPGTFIPSGLPDKACKCVKSGKFTAFVCNSNDGRTCIMGSGVQTWSASTKKRLGVEKCKQNWATASANAAYISAATHIEYAHGSPRMRVPRVIMVETAAEN